MSRVDSIRRKMRRDNIVRFLVWWVLVTACVTYLIVRPAERQAINTWFSVLYDNANIVFVKLSWGPRQAYENKLQHEMRVDELANVAEISQICLPRDVYENIITLEQEVKTMNIEEYMKNSLNINIDIADYKSELDYYCSRNDDWSPIIRPSEDIIEDTTEEI